jgi:predicted GNAT family N-acyltransferase
MFCEAGEAAVVKRIYVKPEVRNYNEGHLFLEKVLSSAKKKVSKSDITHTLQVLSAWKSLW